MQERALSTLDKVTLPVLELVFRVLIIVVIIFIRFLFTGTILHLIRILYFLIDNDLIPSNNILVLEFSRVFLLLNLFIFTSFFWLPLAFCSTV